MQNVNLPIAEISNVKKGFLSACEFDAKFKGMRKAQNFIVYPVKSGASSIVIQSDTRIGEVFLETGVCRISENRSGGAHFIHLAMAENNAIISVEDLQQIKAMLNLKSGNGTVILGESMQCA